MTIAPPLKILRTIVTPVERLRFPAAKSLGLAPPMRPPIGPCAAFAGAAMVVAVVLLVFGQGLRGDLFLPMISGTFFALAALVAVLAWRKPRNGPWMTYWDVAGALTLIGVFTAAAVEPEQMVRLVAGEHQAP